MNYDAWFKSLNQNGGMTHFLGQEGTISKEACNYQQEKIDELRSLFESVVSDDMKTIQRLESVIDENNVDIKKLQERVDITLALIDTTSYSEIERRLPDFIEQLKDSLKGNKDEK